MSWQTEKNGPIACGNEIKDDAGFWRHPQISSAKNKTSGFLGSFFLGGRTSAVFADF
ncbi:hypothetical protein [Lacticaseibacillus manihotivorans]|uniref:hypothetical protein n=1 Tax=Lacticaseibacillus manihotivorans TaxID=88233 RepID=UPI001FB326BC|nr:hypothetical protein [Lacticaseibacillus manihotivorans]